MTLNAIVQTFGICNNMYKTVNILTKKDSIVLIDSRFCRVLIGALQGVENGPTNQNVDNIHNPQDG